LHPTINNCAHSNSKKKRKEKYPTDTANTKLDACKQLGTPHLECPQRKKETCQPSTPQRYTTHIIPGTIPQTP
jgi:hypothetical protein